MKEGIEKIEKEEDKEILNKEEIDKTTEECQFFEEAGDIKYFAKKTEELAKELDIFKATVFTPTETSAVPYGYAVKEAWRVMHPKEKDLKVIPINTKALVGKSVNKTWTNKERKLEKERIVKHYKERFNKQGLDFQKDRILVFDEAIDTGQTLRGVQEIMHESGLRYFPSEVRAVPFSSIINEYYTDKEKNLWVEGVKRVPDPTKKGLKQEEYGRLAEQLGIPRKDREKVKAVIHDMKLIGKKVGEKLKE